MSDKELILMGVIIQLILNVVFIMTLWKLEIKLTNLQLKEDSVEPKLETNE